MTTTNHFVVRPNKGSWRGERMQVKTFEYADGMHATQAPRSVAYAGEPTPKPNR